MAEAVVIRELSLAELAAYKALRDGMLEGHPEAFTSDAATERAKPALAYANRIDTGGADHASGRFTLGAWQGDTLIGAISIERERRTQQRHIARLAGMMVRDDRAGCGIGRALLSSAIDSARRLDGLELLTLSVTQGNLPAIALYEQAGFEAYGCLQRAVKLEQRYLDKLQMVLAL